MNDAMRAALGGRGCPHLTSVFGARDPQAARGHAVECRNGPVVATVIEVPGEDGRREIYFLCLGGSDYGNVRV